MFIHFGKRMAQCKICNAKSGFISEALTVRSECLMEKPEDALPSAMEAHKKNRLASDCLKSLQENKGGFLVPSV